MGGVPAGLIHDNDGVAAWGNLAADFGEMQVHSLVVGARHHEGGTDAALRGDRPEHVG